MDESTKVNPNEKRMELLSTLSVQLREEYCGFEGNRVQEKANQRIKEEIELYLEKLAVWPDIQQAIAANQDKIQVIALKENGEISVSQVLHQEKYSTKFVSNYHSDIISNKPDGKTEWYEVGEHRTSLHGNSRARPLSEVIGRAP